MPTVEVTAAVVPLVCIVVAITVAGVGIMAVDIIEVVTEELRLDLGF
jgi:hypothetical protein